ncbi:hypothetical protein BDP55DRAFT_398978 [Colletotrichum godetiae]|uniref:Uncharacterized protein n=1 Tax=Colletotrichum godetiae TaxID=1209918 RepID=A0AAJ0ER76_9PEZI|nr:uncharacterized protein BDP55DRAFT_398978 [Colletotrichum godetiae]KAK1658294.1 hypothetical protein BDP55DRAFT_398978 [Colletotrichum godetiae]
MKFTSILLVLASAGAVVASLPNAGAALVERDEVVGKKGLEATKTNPRVKRADGTFNLVPRQTQTKEARMISDEEADSLKEKRGEEAVQEKRDDLTPTKTNPRVKRADGTFNLAPRQSITRRAEA